MKSITTTIKKVYMLSILNGGKTIEYKSYTSFWRKRLEKVRGSHQFGECVINFLCGKYSFHYNVKYVDFVPLEMTIDDIFFRQHYRISLGCRLCDHESGLCSDRGRLTFEGERHLEYLLCKSQGICPYQK